jgi:hypothetical protein
VDRQQQGSRVNLAPPLPQVASPTLCSQHRRRAGLPRVFATQRHLFNCPWVGPHHYRPAAQLHVCQAVQLLPWPRETQRLRHRLGSAFKRPLLNVPRAVGGPRQHTHPRSVGSPPRPPRPNRNSRRSLCGRGCGGMVDGRRRQRDGGAGRPPGNFPAKPHEPPRGVQTR